jgi:transcriptional regulator with XRE-family HTH domain
MREIESLLPVLAKNIRTRRHAAGLTQEGLAELAELHRTYIADVERAARNISILNVARIARALKVSVSVLCTDMK